MAEPPTTALRESLLIVREGDASLDALRRAAEREWDVREADLGGARDLADIGRVFARVDGSTSWPSNTDRWPVEEVWLHLHYLLNDLPWDGAPRRTLLWVHARSLRPELLADVASVLAASVANRHECMRDAGPVAQRPDGDPDSLGVVLVVSRAVDENAKLLGSVQLQGSATLCRFGNRAIELLGD